MIDLRTLLVMMAVADLLLAAALWIGASRGLRDGLSHWAIALVVQALALGLLVGVGQHPQAAALGVGGGMLALSFTLQGAALLAFDARQLPTWVHTAVIAGVAVPLQMLANDAGGAILFGGLVLGALLAIAALFAWQVRSAASGSRAGAILVAAFVVLAAVFSLRGAAALFSPDPARSFLAPEGFAAATFLAAFAAGIASTFAFLLLHKERAEAAALRLATMDPLTGAYNRATFHEIAEREMSRARRAGQPLSIIMLDIDHLRAINDRHGHRTGDEVLQRLVEVVRSALRQEDMLVRFNGEQFLVMLPEVPGPGAVVVAGRIRRAVAAEPLQAGGQSLPVTVSLGVAARLDEGPESVDGLIARADSALALAKQRGRDRVVALSLGRSIAA
jgi:diguanylate cyclase (GGDEF)-like protein